MIIIEKYTLFRCEWACVLSERMQVTGFGKNTVLIMAEALKQRLVRVREVGAYQKDVEKGCRHGIENNVQKKAPQPSWSSHLFMQLLPSRKFRQ